MTGRSRLIASHSSAVLKNCGFLVVCASSSARLRFVRTLMTNTDLLCDGCGQPASSEHIAKRLQRLEWTTRYRPIHVGTVLLGASAPADDAEFLYAERGEFLGEAKYVLDACGLVTAGKSWQAVLTEFQRAGFLLTYALECPLDPAINEEAVSTLLQSRMPALLARIRRSLKPKRIVPISLAPGATASINERGGYRMSGPAR